MRAQFGEDVLSFEDQHGHSVVAMTPSRYRELVTFLRNEPEFACDYCDFVSAVDFGDEGMEVVTHLFSTTHDHSVRVKVRLPAGETVLPTISDIYPTANWHERETFDFYGIDFAGHPDLTRILLPADWQGHPLRKDEPLGGVPTWFHGATMPPIDERGMA